MGGLALAHCTKRFDAQDYYKLADKASRILENLFPHSEVRVIRAYNNKPSFGDLDILLESDSLPVYWIDEVTKAFMSKDSKKNGNVLSVEFQEIQVDVIATPSPEFETSYNYFNFNDLGNLTGRLAHAQGMKLGHDGLSYNWRVETYQFKNEIISTDWEVICNVLGLSYERYCEGFDDLEDIFKFVVASPFFNKDIYLLHNRNNYARTRDKKRKTYTDFLKWIENYSETFQQVSNSEWNENCKSESDNKNHWLPHLFSNIPGFEVTYHRVQKEWDDEIEYKKRFNGDLVREWTGLEDQELGKFMKRLKETHELNIFKHFVMSSKEVTLKDHIMQSYEGFKIYGN